MKKLATLALLLSACGGADAAPTAEAAPAPATIDSIFPMRVMIERFQADAGAPLDRLQHGASSRDDLVLQFVKAVEDSSVQALRGLRLDMREFAYLYVPTSRMARPPYEQPPALGWLLVEQNGLKGEARLLRHFGGRPLEYRGYSCSEPVMEGSNTLWEFCTMELGIRSEPVRLFGSIMHRDGRFRFVSLANDL